MANLIEKVNFPELSPSAFSLFRPPEKTLSAERLQPWELLHHSGYWYRAAARHLLARRELALSIPEEDRTPPNGPTQAGISRKAYTHDTYMCPEPYEEYPIEGSGTNHAQLILDHLTLARAEFQKRRQKRISAELALDSCRELQNMGKWQQLLELLTPLWRDMAFRSEGWWDIMEAVSWVLRAAAVETGQKKLIIAIDWELMNRGSQSTLVKGALLTNPFLGFSRRPGWHYDISRSLEGIDVAEPAVIDLDDEHLTSFIYADFVFKSEEGKAGQTCPVQLSIVSKAFPDAVPITIKSLNVHVDGGLRGICLKHEKSVAGELDRASLTLTRVALEEVEGSISGDSSSNDSSSDDSETSSEKGCPIILEGTQDLTLLPGQTRVFEFDIPLREPGEAKATSVQLSLESDTFSLTYNMKPDRTTSSSQWYSSPSSKRRFMRPDPRSIRILPRPPKMEIRAPRILEQYYTNEAIQLDLDIVNEEDGDAITKIDTVLRGTGAPLYKVQVDGKDEQSSPTESGDRSLRGIQMDIIGASKSGKVLITLDPVDGPSIIDLGIKVSCHLTSDPATPIIQEASYRLNIVSPFEASYDLLPRIHPDWPSLFDTENIQGLSAADTNSTRPRGLAQKWALVTRYASFAHEDVIVSELEVQVMSTQGSVICTTSKSEALPMNGQILSPKTIEEGHFELISQKLSLDDRSPATADLAFTIKWRRISTPDTVVNVTTLLLPRFYVTASEPRVLATAYYSSSPPPSASPGASPSQLLFLDITIENPSSHFLTFGLTMEPSDDFAFSGAKTTTVNVLPIARRSITYRLLPLVKGAWIRPTLVVRDKYFQKVLKIIPTEGIQSDKDGILLWSPPEDESDDGTEAAVAMDT